MEWIVLWVIFRYIISFLFSCAVSLLSFCNVFLLLSCCFFFIHHWKKQIFCDLYLSADRLCASDPCTFLDNGQICLSNTAGEKVVDTQLLDWFSFFYLLGLKTPETTIYSAEIFCSILNHKQYELKQFPRHILIREFLAASNFFFCALLVEITPRNQ